jgi:hypothetical protein
MKPGGDPINDLSIIRESDARWSDKNWLNGNQDRVVASSMARLKKSGLM